MTITNQTRVLTLFLIIVSLSFGYLIWDVSSKLKQQRAINKTFQKLIKSSFEFSIITNEYIRSKRSARVTAQWENTHASLEIAFANAKKVITRIDDKASLEKIKANEEQAEKLFFSLQLSKKKSIANSSEAFLRKQTQTVSQINLRMQGMLSEASRVSRRSLDRLSAAEDKLSFITSLLIFIFIPVFTAALIFINKRIIQPIVDLQGKAKRLAAGHYNEKISVSGNNEISELAKIFNSLGEEIDDQISSITEKSNKLLRSEIELSNLNKNLKQKVSEQTLTLQESEYRQRAILESMTDAVVTLDSNFIVISANPSTAEIFGFSEKELIGRNINMLLIHQPGNKAFTHECLEAQGRHKNKSLFPVEVSINEVFINNETLYACIIRDNTERKRVEKMKSEFVSTVSHELRTPLTSINGALKLATSGLLGENPDKTQDLLILANRNTLRLMSIINDILDIQKIESGKLDFHYKEIDLMTEIESIIDENINYAEEYDVKYAIGARLDNIRVTIDPVRLSQILANLLSNAAKFSPEGEIVTIDAYLQYEHIRISVTNKGEGIPVEYHDKIFNKFSQNDSSSTRAAGGTGLGLSIAKKMIEAMDGKIDFTSTLGEGSTFNIYINRQKTLTDEN